MKTFVSAVALAAALIAAAPAAAAQTPPSGGPEAKGNAPLKRAHTVEDGAAKRGRTSFTQGQAKKHIEKSGYSDVSALAKGKDGVWRGTAMKGGASVNVGLDFKGNVVEGGPAGGGATSSGAVTTTTTTSSQRTDMVPTATADAGAATAGATAGAGAATASGAASARHHRRHHRRHHAASRCAQPGPNGVACSGIDRNRNGVSDKEDRAISKGAKP